VAIERSSFKGEEALVLESEGLRATVLPGRGGKLASLYAKAFGRELLWQLESGSYPPLGVPPGPFSAADSNGFDDMFPTIDPCPYPGEGPLRGAAMPDHGELWSAAMAYSPAGEAGLELRADGRAFPYRFAKTVTLEPGALLIRYEAENLSDREFRCLWAAHPLFASRPGMRIEVPPECDRVVNAYGTAELGPVGAEWPYPLGSGADLSLVHLGTGLCRKYYFSNPLTAGTCALRDRDGGYSVKLSFPAGEVPYLGVWVNEGGWHGQNNVALEPAWCGMDSPAAAAVHRMEGRPLGGRERRRWHLRIEVA